MGDSIVVGVKDASAARRAADWAAERAAVAGRTLVLLAVVGGAVGTVGEGDALGRALASARALVEAEARRLARPGLEIETHVAAGDPVGELVEASRGAALLVIGSDHPGAEPEGGKGRGHRGPHGTRIASGAHSPVAVVPESAPAGRSGVVVGIDGSDVTTAAVEFAAAEAAATGERLVAVSAWTPVPVSGGYAELGAIDPEFGVIDLQDATEALVGRSLEAVREAYPALQIEIRVQEGDAAWVIDDAAREARLAVVGSHGRGPFARFFLGSVSTAVLEHLATVTVVAR